jgi:hypothetical protein
MMDGEDHQEMYRRLKAIATTFKNLGAHHIDDTTRIPIYCNKIYCYDHISLQQNPILPPIASLW